MPLHSADWLKNYIEQQLLEIDVEATTATETAEQMTRDIVAAFNRLASLEAATGPFEYPY